MQGSCGVNGRCGSCREDSSWRARGRVVGLVRWEKSDRTYGQLRVRLQREGSQLGGVIVGGRDGNRVLGADT